MSIQANEPSYEEYVKWDEARRVAFPNARHWIYQSRVGDTRVAEWSICGQSSIMAKQ